MAIININFDKKSIQNAIKQVEQIKKKMNTEVPTAFLRRCLNWVQVRANEYLSSFNIDPKTINDIKSKWETDIAGSIGKLTNTSDKAVFIDLAADGDRVEKMGELRMHRTASFINILVFIIPKVAQGVKEKERRIEISYEGTI